MLACLLLSLVLVQASLPATETFDQAWGKAAANLATPEGKKYDTSLGTFARAHHTPHMDACFAAVAKPDRSAFQLALRVGADGSIERALAKPETNLAVCFRDRLKQGKLPSPPAPGYWVQVEMSIGK